MEWTEKEVSAKYLKSFVMDSEGITLTVNLRKYEYENADIQAWDVIMADGSNNIGRTVIHGRKGNMDVNPDWVFEQAVMFMREHLMGKMDYHCTNYEKWKSRSRRFERMVV